MAVDFFVMPFSKYIAGDFVTPIMQFAWDSGIPYTVHTANGPLHVPPGMPMGGANARTFRANIQHQVARDVRALGGFDTRSMWDEAADFDGRFHRMHHREYAALLHLSEDRKHGFLGIRTAAGISELAAGVFLPQHFKGLFAMEEPLVSSYASAPYVLERLQTSRLPDAVSEIVGTFRNALNSAIETGFPLIVEA